MFCPGCSLEITDDLKFCRRCGANLRGVREAMVSGSTQDKFDWSKTWVADMFLNEEERERRRFTTVEERQLHEERKRINEIKGGIITALAGVGVMFFLYFFLAVVANQQPSDVAEIVRHVWLCGIIPVLVGIGLIINGIFISPRFVKFAETLTKGKEPALQTAPPASLPDKSTAQIPSEAGAKPGYSVVEETTVQFPTRDTH